MLDDKDIKKLQSIFATKKDFNNLVTKQDLKGLVTKKDLEVQTANNIKIFATKEDLDKVAANSLKIFATKKDVEEIRSDIADMKELLQGLLVSTDAIAKSIGELKMEYAAISTQLTRHERWIKQIAEKVGLNLVME